VTAAFRRYLPLLILAVVWEGITRLGIVSALALPPLTRIAAAFVRLLQGGDLWTNAMASLYRGGMGLLIAVAVGGSLGVGMAWWRPVRTMMSPIVEIFYPLPKSALIPVTALWLGFGNSSKILLIFLGCMLPVTLGAFNGARGSEQELVWLSRSMGASKLRTLIDVVIPSALPELLNGIRTALATAFVLLVSSELIAAQSGLGYLIGFLGDGGNYDGMFAVVMLISLLGFAADRIYVALMGKALQWRE